MTTTERQPMLRLIGLIDLTSLNDSDTEATVAALAAQANTRHGKVAALCVWPRFIGVARAGSDVPIATVVNFSRGSGSPDSVARETEAAVRDGADEIDMVLPYRLLIAGDRAVCLKTVQACRHACGPRALLKVILETGELADPTLIRTAAETAIEGGAHFLKTSTGKTPIGATPAAAAALFDVIAEAGRHGQRIGFKASGGVRTLKDGLGYLAQYDERFGAGAANAGNCRLGASVLLREILLSLMDKREGMLPL